MRLGSSRGRAGCAAAGARRAGQPVLGLDIAQGQRHHVALGQRIERGPHVMLGQQRRQFAEPVEFEPRSEGITLEQRMSLRQPGEDFDDGRGDARTDLHQRLDQRLRLEDGMGIGLEQQRLVGEARPDAGTEDQVLRDRRIGVVALGVEGRDQPRELAAGEFSATAQRASTICAFASARRAAVTFPSRPSSVDVLRTAEHIENGPDAGRQGSVVGHAGPLVIGPVPLRTAMACCPSGSTRRSGGARREKPCPWA